MQHLNYAALLQAGQNLVPDLRSQLLFDQRHKAEMHAHKLQQQRAVFALEAARRSAEDEASYAIEAAEIFRSPTADRVRALQARYPKYTDAAEKAWEGWKQDGRGQDVIQISSILSNLRAGNHGRAAEIARERYEADLSAGIADDEDRHILKILEEGDPERLSKLGGLLMMQLAAISGPDKLASSFQDLSEEARQQDLHPLKLSKAEEDRSVAAAEAASASDYFDARARHEGARAEIAESDARFRDQSNASIIRGRDARTAKTQRIKAPPRPRKQASRAGQPTYSHYARNPLGERIGFNAATKQWERLN